MPTYNGPVPVNAPTYIAPPNPPTNQGQIAPITVNPAGSISINTGTVSGSGISYIPINAGSWIAPGTIFTLTCAPTATPSEEDKQCEPEKKKEFDCKCTKCREDYPYAAEPEDGKDFICWACRHNY